MYFQNWENLVEKGIVQILYIKNWKVIFTPYIHNVSLRLFVVDSCFADLYLVP